MSAVKRPPADQHTATARPANLLVSRRRLSAAASLAFLALITLIAPIGCARDPRNPFEMYTARNEAFRKEIDELELAGLDFDAAKAKLVEAGYKEQGSGGNEEKYYFQRQDLMSRKEMGVRNVTIQVASNKVADVKTSFEATAR